jgi:hypothetical protein
LTEEEDAEGGPEEGEVGREGLREGGKEERGVLERVKFSSRLSFPPSLPPSLPTSISLWLKSSLLSS